MDIGKLFLASGYLLITLPLCCCGDLIKYLLHLDLVTGNFNYFGYIKCSQITLYWLSPGQIHKWFEANLFQMFQAIPEPRFQPELWESQVQPWEEVSNRQPEIQQKERKE